MPAELVVGMPAMSQLESELLEVWRDVTGRAELTLDDSFMEIGGTPSLGTVLIERLEEKYDKIFHLVWLLAAPTVREQARWMESTWMGGEGEPPKPEIDPAPETWRGIYNQGFGALSRLAPPVRKNPQACFILSPGRSGSTLLRTMLAGHPGLFSPPELELLLFPDMQLRHEGLLQGWADLHGLESAVRYLWDCSHEDAERIVTGWRMSNLDTLHVFAQIQERCSPRLVVDQTTSLAVVEQALRRLEESFEEALFIHLQRHPLAVIRSWKNANFAQIIHAWPHSTAQNNWLLSHQNALTFLETIPAKRQIALRYEDLVTEPEVQMRRLADFLGLDFHPGTLNPYEGDRMTVNSSGRFSGDKKFLNRKSVDPSVAQSSERRAGDGPLLEETVALAKQFGYEDL